MEQPKKKRAKKKVEEQQIEQAVEQDGYWQGEERLVRKSGFYFPVNLRVNAIMEYGIVRHYVCAFQDLAEQRSTEAQIERLAYSSTFSAPMLLEAISMVPAPYRFW